MAFWVVGGSGPPDVPEQSIYGTKRTTYYDHDHYHGHHDDYEASKRVRLEEWGGVMNQPSPTGSDSVRVKNLAFLVIREGTQTPEDHHHPYSYPPPPQPPPPPPPPPPLPRTLTTLPPPAVPFSSTPMERTESGLSISSDTSNTPSDSPLLLATTSPPLLSDLQAAHLVRCHVSSSRHDSQPSRILRSLIRPRMDPSPGRPTRAFPLDDTALRSLFRAANALFFAHRLSNRVAWDWSLSSPRYAHHVVGTTALRRSSTYHGYETLIVLSSPILRDTRYNRRLLIATFLHEMIHSFLFVTCGMKAARGGGHTEGFRMIAETIDEWVGRGHLRLADMEADLERFRGGDGEDGDSGGGYAAHPPPPAAAREHGGWEWCEQEGFRTRGPTGATGSSYVL